LGNRFPVLFFDNKINEGVYLALKPVFRFSFFIQFHYCCWSKFSHFKIYEIIFIFRSARWHSAALVYKTSRSHSPVPPGDSTPQFVFPPPVPEVRASLRQISQETIKYIFIFLYKTHNVCVCQD
jgi:hypothetical protein